MVRLRLFPVFAIIGALTSSKSFVAAQSIFQALSPGSGMQSCARGISNDGSVVVGYRYSAAGYEAFRWTAQGGMQVLGDIPGGQFHCEANAVSNSGSMVVGFCVGRVDIEAFRWTAGGVMQSMQPTLATWGGSSSATGVSDYGSVIVGRVTSLASNSSRAFGWRPPNDVFSILFSTSTGPNVYTNADGSIMAGTVVCPAGECPVRWLNPGAYTNPELLGINGGRSNDISPNGNIIVGWSYEGAFRWHAPSVVTMLQSGLWTQSNAFGTSADGAVVVGSGSRVDEMGAFIWDELHGMRLLQEVLESDLGLDLTGWMLTSASGISDDGKTIVGCGYSSGAGEQSWIVHLPTCPTPTGCDDGLYCNGVETCDAILGCQAGTPPTCDDGVACTVDTCVAASDSCSNIPSDALCDDGDPCNGTESCNATASCVHTLSADCNGNGIADECDIANCSGEFACSDCNENGIPDECDIANCPPEDTSCQDCDADGVMNGCEPVGEYCQSDADCDDGRFCTVDWCNPEDCTCHHLVADPCCEPTGACPCSIGCENWGYCCDSLTNTCLPPGVPQPIADPEQPKTRFISMSIPGGGQAAIRVTLTSLHHVVPVYPATPSIPFTMFEGQVRWVGPPVQYRESASDATTFMTAALQCQPYYQDWSTVGLMHVTGSAIVPSSVYDVQAIDISCLGNEANCTAMSCSTQIKTTRWGDVTTPFQPPSTTTQPNLTDLVALVDKFKSAPGALSKVQTLLVGDDAFGNFSTSTMNLSLGFTHISADVNAFAGYGYPHTIQTCP